MRGGGGVSRTSREVPVSMEALTSQFLGHIERMEFSSDKRAGVRCGAGDAATICRHLARQILADGRQSKKRDDLAAVAERCGDIIMAYYDRVRVQP